VQQITQAYNLGVARTGEGIMRSLPFFDNDFVKTVLRIAVPISVQGVVTASLGMVDVMMIGQLGDTPVAGVGLANQIFFLLSLVLFGIGSGTAIFTAQYWGQRDIEKIRRVMGIGLGLGLLTAGVFTVVSLAAPEWVLGIYTTDPGVIGLGSAYLRIVALSFFMAAITEMYSITLRSVEDSRLPMVVSIVALTLNSGMNLVLIFGYLGFPAMGVIGAAIATTLARILECGMLLWLTYRKNSPVAARWKELWYYNPGLWKQYFVTALPTMFNELTWSLGMTTYFVIFARISTDSVAAVSIAYNIDIVAIMLFSGVTGAAGVMIGNKIGAGQEAVAFQHARRFMGLSVIGGVATGTVMALAAGPLLTIYNISETASQYTLYILLILAVTLPIRVSNMVLIAGVLRSGGDTRFTLILDTCSIWLVGIPIAASGAFWLQLPVYWVVGFMMVEEVFKFSIAAVRMLSRRWINNLVMLTPAAQPLPAE
jgi:putative MATE family efflux protein